jgi:hypothetical protein
MYASFSQWHFYVLFPSHLEKAAGQEKPRVEETSFLQADANHLTSMLVQGQTQVLSLQKLFCLQLEGVWLDRRFFRRSNSLMCRGLSFVFARVLSV